MSNALFRKIRKVAETTVVESAWVQWAAITAAVAPTGEGRAWTIVDPEALLLASLAVGKSERRLLDVASSTVGATGFPMSVQRMRTLVGWFPQGVGERLGAVAQTAVELGDLRWKRLASMKGAEDYTSRKKPIGPLRLLEGPALMLRIRTGFGVNAKADVLSVLLGMHGASADLKVLTAASGYTDRAIRTATAEMTLAGLLHEIEGRPSSFQADCEAWSRVLQAHTGDHTGVAIPHWRFWSAVYAFLAQVIHWADRAENEAWTDYVASSRARDLVEECRGRLQQAQVELPRRVAGRGAAFLGDFEELVVRVESWVAGALYGHTPEPEVRARSG